MSAITNLIAIRGEIAEACARAGRAEDAVTLVGASKTVEPDVLAEVIEAGLLVFGENRVQEARSKWPDLRSRYPGVELHLIGPLQSNKVREALELFDVIQSVDRPSLCAALARQVEKDGRQPKLFVQVNTGAEEQKSGVLPDDADGFLAACRDTYGLKISGLMCIPPAGAPPEADFDLLAKIAERNGIPALSMGMSTDYASAVEHGATHVRVGSALFGRRA